MFLSVTSAQKREVAMALLTVCVVRATNVLHSNVRMYCVYVLALKNNTSHSVESFPSYLVVYRNGLT